VTQLVFSPTGPTLASIAMPANAIKLWTFAGKGDQGVRRASKQPTRVAFLGDGKQVASPLSRSMGRAARRRRTKVWDARDRQGIPFAEGTNTLAKRRVQRRWRRFACASPSDADVRVWDLLGQLAFTLVRATDDLPPQSLVALDADGAKLAAFEPLTERLGVYKVPGDQTSVTYRRR